MIPHQLAGVFFVVAGDPEGNQFANFRGSDLRGFAHVLLWFAVVAFDVIKMNEIMSPVYRENRFSVDFKENPMFAGVKQVSLFWSVGLAGVLLGVFRERCVGPEIDVVVGVEHPGAALDLECHHHQFH